MAIPRRNNWVPGCLLLCILSFNMKAQPAFVNDNKLFLTNTILDTGSIDLSKQLWKFHPGDDLQWAGKDFDDSDWANLAPSFNSDSAAKVNWQGIGWFRLSLAADSTVRNSSLALSLFHYGASEIYFDGKLLKRFGKVGTSEENQVLFQPAFLPVGLHFNQNQDHVLAIRYSFFNAGKKLERFGYWRSTSLDFAEGFKVKLGKLSTAIQRLAYKQDVDILPFGANSRIAILALIALLHIGLFFLDKRDKSHIYLGILSFGMILNLLLFHLTEIRSSNVDLIIFADFSGHLGILISGLMWPAAMQTVFYGKIRPWLKWMMGISILFFFSAIIFPSHYIAVICILMLVLEAIRVAIWAAWNRKEGSKILGLGAMLFISGLLIYVFFEYLPYFLVFIAVDFTSLGPPLSISIFLAQRFANTNRKLEEAKQTLEIKVEERTSSLKKTLQDLQQAQDQLIHSEKMASLGALTAGIAHEIKNPLNFVNNFAELSKDLSIDLGEALQKNDAEAIFEIVEDLKNNSEKIAHHGKRADSIVRSMMQHARSGSGQRESIAINDLVDEYLNLAYHGKRAQSPDFNVSIERDFSKEITTAEIIPQDFGRVLLNIIGNAFDAVQAYSQEDNDHFNPRIRVSTRKIVDAIEVRIEDNGPGISEDIKGKIFDPFFTTKPTGIGLGLGLSLSHEIIANGHNGSLTVENPESGGTAFIIKLPQANSL